MTSEKSEVEREKILKRNINSWVDINKFYITGDWSPEKKERKNKAIVFQEIMAENFPNLVKDTFTYSRSQ